MVKKWGRKKSFVNYFLQKIFIAASKNLNNLVSVWEFCLEQLILLYLQQVHKNNQNRLKNPWTALKDKHFNIWNENDFKKNTTDNVVFTKPAVVLNWNVICLQVTYCIIITKFIVSLFFSHIDLNFSTDRKMKNTFCLSL